MDVAKYISLYLLKNGTCSVNGLGTFTLEHTSSVYNNEQLSAPVTTVTFQREEKNVEGLNSFIAKNHYITTEETSQYVQEYTASVNDLLETTGEAQISHLGKLVNDEGKIMFVTGEQMFPALSPIEVKRQEVNAEEYNTETTSYGNGYPDEKKSNTGVIILILFMILALAAGGYYWYANYYTPQADKADIVATPHLDDYEEPVAVDSTEVDTLEPLAASPVAIKDGVLSFKAVINTYNSIARAEKREKQLNSYGLPVQVETIDSTDYYIILPVQTSTLDTNAVLDSLKLNYNPKGVSIYRN